MNSPSTTPSQTLSARPEKATKALDEIVDRFLVFEELWAALDEELTGPALIYRLPGLPEVRSLPLDLAVTVVGRLARSDDSVNGADLSFPGTKALSKRHFSIRRTEDGFVLEDLSSKNGTFVNTSSARASSKELVGGDLIYAGGIVFAFTGD